MVFSPPLSKRIFRFALRPFASAALVPAVFMAALLAGPPGWASDGVFEINETCAQVGCFAGDVPGYPVTLSLSGSYRLTSDLEPAGANGIQVAATSVRIDLGGFSIRGPGDCTGFNGASISCVGNAGVGVDVSLGLGDSVAVDLRGGTIRGMSLGVGFFGSDNASIEDLRVIECSSIGISLGSGRISDVVVMRNGGDGITVINFTSDYTIQNSNISRNGGDGINVGGGTGLVRGNVLSDNAGWGIFSEFIGFPSVHPAFAQNSIAGNDLGQVRGGTSIGGNFCSPVACP